MSGQDIIKEHEEQAQGLDFSHLKSLPKPESSYPTLEKMVEFIQMNDADHVIDVAALSKNGVVTFEPIEKYLRAPAISSSICKEYLKTPLHGFYAQNQTIPKKDKSHFDLGTFIHMAFLEPELFDRCIIEPKASRSSGEGCATLQTFYMKALTRALQEGLISKDEFELVAEFNEKDKIDFKKKCLDLQLELIPYQIIEEDHKAIIDVIKSNYYRYGNGIIPRLLKNSVSELSMYGTDPSTGLKVKVRPDAIQVKENIGVDAIISLKSTASDNLQKFFYDSGKYSYELSEGMYQEVVSEITDRKFNATIMIMVQTVAPYLPAVFFWDSEDIDNGKYKYGFALQTIKESQEADSYPGFDAQAESGHFGIIKMKQPDWTKKELHPVDVEN